MIGKEGRGSLAKGYEIDMTHGKLLPKIIKFCIPLMLSNLLQVFYNAADVIVAGRFAGQHAIAAIGSSTHIFSLFTNFFIGMSMGANVVISQQIGSGDTDSAQKSVHTSVTVSAVFGTLIAVAGFFLSRGMLVLTNCTPDVLEQASLYLKILFLGMPAQMVYNYCAAILRSAGDTKHPLYFLTISGILNIILNVIMVTVFHKMADGVAIATVISQYVSVVLVMRLLLRTDGVCNLNPKKLGIDKDSLKAILRVGLPTGIQSTVFSISNVVIQSSVNTFGTAVVAGSAAAANIESFEFTAMDSVSTAALAFTGQNVGARRIDRLKMIAIDCIFVTTAVAVTLGVITAVFAKNLLAIYIPGETKAIASGAVRVTIFGLSYFICGIMNIFARMCCGMYRSLGSMIISMTGACGLRILWIYTVLPLHRSFFMLMLCYPISWGITMIALFIYYKHSKKDLKLKLSQAPSN